MPLPKIDEVRNLSDTELAAEIITKKKELFELRLQKATRQLDKTHGFKHLRHRIAQLLTVERERELAAKASGSKVSTDETMPEATGTQASAPEEE